jgi:hypothetical protein
MTLEKNIPENKLNSVDRGFELILSHRRTEKKEEPQKSFVLNFKLFKFELTFEIKKQSSQEEEKKPCKKHSLQ